MDEIVKNLLKAQKDKVDMIYKTIGGIVLFCCCGAIGWAGNNIISQNIEITKLQGRADKMEATSTYDRNEAMRNMVEVNRRLDRLEQEVNHRLELIDEKLDKVINKHNP